MLFKTCSVSIQDIDIGDHSFQVTTDSDIDNLTESIRDIGLLNPPILKKTKTGFLIISGFRRVKACFALDLSEIDAKVLIDTVSEEDCRKIAVTENCTQRTLNLVELARAYRLLEISSNKKLPDQNRFSGLPDNPKFIAQVTKIDFLPEKIKQAVINNIITLPVISDLDKFDKKTAIEFVNLFEYLGLGLNKQREIIMLVNEISQRDDINCIDILRKGKIREIFDSTEIDRPQKAGAIRFHLRKTRFPSVCETEENFKKMIKQLNLPKTVQLTPPRYFEGTVYNLSLRFKDPEELKNHIIDLKKISENPTLEKILRGFTDK